MLSSANVTEVYLNGIILFPDPSALEALDPKQKFSKKLHTYWFLEKLKSKFKPYMGLFVISVK